MTSRKGGAVARLPLPLAVALVLAVAVGACSGKDKPQPLPASPLGQALSYVPRGAGAVTVLDTSSTTAAATRIYTVLDSEVRSQLGNPVALAVGAKGERIEALRAQDPVELDRRLGVEAHSGRASHLDDYHGAAVYETRGAGRRSLRFLAVTRGDLVLADSKPSLETAIDAARGTGNAAREAAVTSALAGLGGGLLLRGVGDAQRLLAGLSPAQAPAARRIPWVRALGRFTLAARMVRGRLLMKLKLASDRINLSERDLPIAPGSKPPLLHDLRAPATVGVRKPDLLARFLERSLAVTSPNDFARYQAGIGQLRTFFGVDLHRDLLSKIKNLSIAFGPRAAITFNGKLEPGSTRAVLRALDGAQPFFQAAVRRILPGATIALHGSGAARTWTITRGGLTVGRYGVRGGTLLGSIGFAAAPPNRPGRRLPGLAGSVSIHSAPSRIRRLLGLVPGLPVEAVDFLSRLGEVSLGVQAVTRGLTAKGTVVVGR